MKQVAIICLILLSTPSFAADLPCQGATCIDTPKFDPAPGGGGGIRPQAVRPEQAPAGKPAEAKKPSDANAQAK